MNRKRIIKAIIISLGVFIPLGVFGFGYFSKEESINNQITKALVVDGEISEGIVEVSDGGIVPGDIVDKTIDIQSNATTPSLVRVKIQPQWYDGDDVFEDNEINKNITIKYLESANIDDDLDGKISENANWYKEGDYLYYLNSVADKTINLVDKIEFTGSGENVNDLQNKSLKLNIELEMIQCKYGPYKQAWSEITENSDLDKKLETLCPDISK